MGVFKTLLQRMTLGLLLGVLSFLIASFLEYRMQEMSKMYNPVNQMRVVNLLPDNLIVQSLEDNKKFEFGLPGFKDGTKSLQEVKLSEELLKSIQVNGSVNVLIKSNEAQPTVEDKNYYLKRTAETSLNIIYPTNSEDVLNIHEIAFSIKYQQIGISEMKIHIVDYLNKYADRNLTAKLSNSKLSENGFKIKWFPERGNQTKEIIKDLKSAENPDTAYIKIDYSVYKFELIDDQGKVLYEVDDLLLETCGRYSIVVFPVDYNEQKFAHLFMREIQPNGLSIFWQIIQIFVMSVAEILFSVSGVTFAYSQAPASMKSVMQAMWFLTVAFGNLIVIAIAEARITDNQVIEYIIFAALLFAATLIFIVLANFYKYTDEEEKPSEAIQGKEKDYDRQPEVETTAQAPPREKEPYRQMQPPSPSPMQRRRQSPPPPQQRRSPSPMKQRQQSLPPKYDSKEDDDDGSIQEEFSF